MTDDTISKKRTPSESRDAPATFPIVGIGASAGGLKALEELFNALPGNTGMGFVVIQHLARDHKSILPEILARHTKMKVRQAKNNMKVKPNSVSVLPPGYDMAILNGRLQLIEIISPHGQDRPVSYFLKSLAQDAGNHAICVMLSGTGSDGSKELREIKSVGGLIIAQRPDSAEYDDMPKNAINTGFVDLILTPLEMGDYLAKIGAGLYRITQTDNYNIASETADYLQKIFLLIRARTGHDFSGYKEGTVTRRVERRMSVHQINRIAHYVRFLQQHEEEVDVLFQDLLIGVTSFFRNHESFVALRKYALTPLITNRPNSKPLRIWVVGCSSGEEAYSIAMLISELMDQSGWQGKVQIFATDIDRESIRFARRGLYSANTVDTVSKKRKLRYFKQKRSGFKVRKILRDMVIFAEQDVVKDPPFSNLDLISCRNLLIYMGPELHQMMFPIFYHALAANGFLLLGNSENIGIFGEYFKAVHQKERLFQQQGCLPRRSCNRLPHRIIPRTASGTGFINQRQTRMDASGKLSVQRLTEKKLLSDFTPATALINKNRDVLYCHGAIADFLRLPAGETRYDILSLAQPEIRLELGKAIRASFAEGQPVKKTGITCKVNDIIKLIDLWVMPVGERQDDQMSLVVFTVVECPEKILPARIGAEDFEKREQPTEEMEKELRHCRDRIFSLTEEAAVADFESRSIQEELQSSNQELLSINEELETSREELQSTTEELITVNQELELRVEELSKVSNDMINLLAATNIGTIFLDTDLVIQRFTPAVGRIINLIESDVGRPLTDLHINLDYDSLADDALSVLDTLCPVEKEIPILEYNRWYLVRFLPYRTIKGEVQGVVISFIDITRRRQAEQEVKRSWSELEQLFNTAVDGMRVVRLDHSILRVNDTFVSMTGSNKEECMLKKCRDLFPGPWCGTEKCTLKRVLQGELLVDEEVVKTLPDGSKMTMALTARPFVDEDGKVVGVIEDFRDISKIKESEEQFRSIFNNSAEAIIWADTATGRIIRCNRQAEKLLGWSRDELITMHQTRIHPPDQEEKYRKIFADHIRKGGICKDELELYTSDGQSIPTEVNASIHDIGKIQIFQGIFRDRSKENALQKKLTQQKELAARYLDIAGSLILAVNRDGSVALINRIGCEILGFSKKELVGRNWFDTCIPARKREEIRMVFNRLMQGEIEPVTRYSNSVLTADGTEIQILWYNSLLTSSDQKIIGTLSAGNVIGNTSEH